ncbi:MAG: iron-containing alcohol dehydrogenase [Methylocystaceae bacterium]|nr:iron-containing alcohol dehydrogenase [Methylocystaceae bacterium]
MRLTKTVGDYYLGSGALKNLDTLLKPLQETNNTGKVAYLIDHYFLKSDLKDKLPIRENDILYFIDTTDEPTTEQVDKIAEEFQREGEIIAAVGIGGGSTLDITKAIANLIPNGAKAEDYQGWDLVPGPGIFKIGIPTISGTGAEGSRTCVLMNHAKKLKLGHNSDYTVYNRLIMDPDLTASVPKDQYFYTGMDTFIHCIESLEGRYRHSFADALSDAALSLSRKIFLSDDMQSKENRESLMVASFMGGSAIGNSFVGVVHPFSAGLSMVLGLHHCIGNCIVMNVMDQFYPSQTQEFHRMLEKQSIKLPTGLCANLTDKQHQNLYDATIVHEKPLMNALGDDFKKTLTPSTVRRIFERM